MNIRGSSWRLRVGGAVVLLVAALVAGVLLSNNAGGSPDRTSASAPASDGAAAPEGSLSLAGLGAGTLSSTPPGMAPAGTGKAADPAVTLSLDGNAVGRPIASGFLGFSFEFQAVRAYTGTNPSQINPVLMALIRNLTPGQAPVLRIGGDSTDVSYAPAAGVAPPAFVDYPLSPGWMATTAALAHQLRARLIMGLNLVANEPRLGAVETRDYVKAFGAGSIEALEIGNEPNVYRKVTVFDTAFGVPVPARPSNFGYPAFRRQFAAIAAAAPSLTLAGPALAVGPTPGPGSWVKSMPDFLAKLPRVSIMTVHRYPLRNCYVPPKSPQYPSIPHLLSNYATQGMAASLKPWIRIAHRQDRQIRVDEVNSVACRGKTGVSDTFASALWATDALFSLARAGVDGIDMHTLPDSAYELFSFSHSGGRWEGAVAPVYYGLQLFAQAAPAGSRLLTIGRRGAPSDLSTWGTRAPDGTVRLVLITKSPARDRTVRIRTAGAGSATVERMLAPSVSSRSGVTLGGATYGTQTSTGQLAAPHQSSVTASNGIISVSVPHGSAALVTLTG